MHYYTDDDKRKIDEAAKDRLYDVISDFVTLDQRSNGPTYTGLCPICGEPKGLELNRVKNAYKCFKCNSISGHSAINFLMRGKQMSYTEALEYLANKFCIDIEQPVVVKKKAPISKKKSITANAINPDSYCKRMLEESGLTDEDVTAHIYKSDDTKSIFQLRTMRSGTIDTKGNLMPGDDAIIEYYDLEGLPVTYEKKDAKGKLTGERKEYFRVRWQHPEAHLDKTGKPFKYKSPYGSGTPIYIPEKLRSLYKFGTPIERLYIQEGEKKAEKACKHNLPSIAISGIQNLGMNGTLPEDVIRIITKCGVKEVVFLMDSDWNDISENIRINDQVEKRPRNFFYACRNFKEYMRSLKNRDIYVECYIGHTKKNEAGDKGLDDLLTNTLKGCEDKLLQDIDFLINEKNLCGEYIQLFKITTWTDHKLEELWSLNSPQKFAEKHIDILRNLPEFCIGRHRWRINSADQLESAQPIESDEQFWVEVQKVRRDQSTYTDYEFKYVRSRRFLQNRGFGRHKRLDNTYQFIHLTPPFVRVIEPSDARDYLFEFTEANCNEDVNELISKGVTQYVGPDKLSLLKFIEPNFINPSREYQYFYFDKCCWKITANSIEPVGYESISHHIWIDQMRPFPAKYIGKPLISFTHKEGAGYDYQITQEGAKCHFLKFLENASNFTWRKEVSRQNGEMVEITAEEIQENKIHLLSKLCAIGYMLMECKDPNVSRAVVAMDGKQSEVGESNGRSGKSLIGELMRQVMPLAYIDGKKRDMFNDVFIWNDIIEKTRLVFIDDVLQSFQFESLFPSITGDWSVNYKGGRRVTFPFMQSPKIFIATNHALRGSGSSFEDRQWLLAFSDYYNSKHKPADDFGCLFFHEWDFEQWNLTWNLLSTCIQLYLQFQVVQAPGERLEQRKLRQEITEGFIAWADEYFSSEKNRNCRITRKQLNESFFEYDPNQRKYVSPTEFKKRFMKYCEWKGYAFNPNRFDPATGKPFSFDKDGRPILDDKAGGVEYFTVGDTIHTVNSQDKLAF